MEESLLEKPHVQDLIEAINSQPKEEKSLAKISKYLGYALGPLASAVVTPFAFKFGERVAESLGIVDEASKKAVGVLFATCGTLGVSSFASFVCSDQFPAIVNSMTNKTLSKVKRVSCSNRVHIGVTTALSTIMTIPGTYLNDSAYRDWLGNGALILDAANFLVWSTVSGWGLYSIPTQAYKALVARYPALSFSEASTDRHKYISIINSLISKSKQMTDQQIDQLDDELYADTLLNKYKVNESWLRNLLLHEKIAPIVTSSTPCLTGKDLAGALGVGAGFASSYFYVPAGMQTGKLLADILHLKLAENGFAYVVGPVSFAIQGAITANSARTCLMNTYESLSQLISQRCQKTTSNYQLVEEIDDDKEEAKAHSLNLTGESTPQVVTSGTALSRDNIQRRDTKAQKTISDSKSYVVFALVLIIAFFSSAHRAEMTAEYVPNNSFGNFLTGLAMFGLFCMNFWGFEGLRTKLFSSTLSESKQTFFGKLQSTKIVLEAADDEYISNLKQEL